MDAASPYCWLTTIPAPRMIGEALGLWRCIADSKLTLPSQCTGYEGELLGRASADLVLDPVPHAATFVALVARRARKTLPPVPQCALNWARFGVEAGQPQLGDVLCVVCEGGGYVGMYVGEDDAHYHVLGVNGDDCIAIQTFPKQRLYAARRPVYQDYERSVRSIRLNRDGSLFKIAPAATPGGNVRAVA